MRDVPSPQPSADGFRAVALVADDVIRPDPGPAGPRAGHPYRVHHGRELGAVVGVPACQHERERAARSVAGQVDFAGQTAAGPSEGRAAEPLFRAPAACWWARTMVESTDTSHSMSPAVSALAWAVWSIRSDVPSAATGGSGVEAGPGAVPLGHVPPGDPGAELPHDPVEDRPVVQPWPPQHGPGQQWLHEFPLGIGQFIATYHHSVIHNPRSL